MRNLKKILALVLALVMSLSLMATAGAESFQDVKDDNPYKTAIDVLTELKVVKGYGDGNFQPDGQLNRAEAAVLVYRIATGDVEDKYLDNYTFMQQSKFTDLDGYNWAKGYINYCQNAGIVVGTDATHFNPGGKVTGYQLLVMLLRTLGYGKAGEFADPKGWELQTAAIAEREGITANVTTGDFGAPAPRAMVAELLFRGLLTETVTYSQLTSGGYTKGETLGMRELGLEEIEGVVVANEFADLYGTQVLAQGKTQLQVEDEDKARTLNTTTLITDIGESRLVYTQNTSKVLSIADTGDNKVTEYGKGVDISSPIKFQTVAEMTQATGTEFFQNFSTTGYYTSDYRIEYIINFDVAYAGYADAPAYNKDAGFTSTNTYWSNNGKTLNRVIPAGNTITLTDYANMRYIFTWSNGIWNPDVDKFLDGFEYGQVYVATQTKEDISDKISFVQFEKDYLNPIAFDAGWSTSDNGEWVKFIDNNGDGVCDYAFRTEYTLDEVISTYTNKAGDTVMQYNGFNDDDTQYEGKYTTRYMEDDEAIERDVAVGDIVLWAIIDNQVLVSKAASVTTQATSYNYKNDEITAADGETYGQSGIDNNTGMQIYIASMAPKTDYEMFLDKFGFVRAYRQPGGTQYALVTELYYTNNANGNLVQNWPMTVELTMPNADGKAETKEYNLSNASGNAFIATTPWTQIYNRSMAAPLQNWLQPAIAHLGVTWTNMTPQRATPQLANSATMTFWGSNQQLVREIQNMNGSTEFNYGRQYYTGVTGNVNGNPVPNDDTVSFTNVAVVGIDGENATINGAARVALDASGRAAGNRNPNSYAVDYIQLDRTKDVAKGAASYPVAPASAAAYNYIVNADKDTEIYVVYNGGVEYYKGFANMPALTNEKNNIHAAYAVARNTATGNSESTTGRTYWMADVIVYEVEKWDNLNKASISLAYYTAFQQMQAANGVTINTLNNKTDPAKVDLIPSGLAWGTTNNWWSQWGYNADTGFGWQGTPGYGFYQLYNTTDAVDGVMTAGAIKKITEKFADSGIFAGTVTREVGTAVAGGYIPVNMTGAVEAITGNLKTEALISIASGKVYSITWEGDTNETSQRTYYEANALQYNDVRWSEVKADDQIIWVGGGTKGTVPNSASFIVDLGNTNTIQAGYDPLLCNSDLRYKTASWLISKDGTETGLWWDIFKDQNPVDTKEYWTITIKHMTGVDASVTDDSGSGDGTLIPTSVVEDTEIKVEKGKPWSIAASELKLPGYTLDAVYNATTGDHPDDWSVMGDEFDTYYGFDIATLNGNKTVVVNYDATGYSLTVKGASNYTTEAAASTYDANGVDKDQAATALTTGGFNLASTSGAPFTVTVAPAAGEIVTEADITVTNAKDVKKSTNATTGVITVTGTIDGAVVVTVTATTSCTVTAGTVKLSDTTTNAPAGAATVTINTPVVASGANATVTVVPAAGYQVISVKNGATPLTAGANNTWTLASVSANATIDVVVGYTVGGPDIKKSPLITAASGTDFNNAVKALGPGLWQIETATGYWDNKSAGSDKRDDDEIVIAFNTGANVSAMYTITDSTGTVKGQESFTFTTDGAHFFNVQILDGNNESNSGSAVDPALTPGTYTVTLVVGGSSTTYTFTVGPVNP